MTIIYIAAFVQLRLTTFSLYILFVQTQHIRNVRNKTCAKQVFGPQTHVYIGGQKVPPEVVSARLKVWVRGPLILRTRCVFQAI